MEREERSQEEDRTIATHVREALARRRISRQRLADEAGISLSTLEKALSGGRPFTLATLVRLEQVLQAPLRSRAVVHVGPTHAPAEFGGYGREAADWLVGCYLTLRPSFERPGAIYAYLIEIAWDEADGRLAFHEKARVDAAFAQSGVVSLPHQSGQVYLVTNSHGQFRTATLSRPTIAGDMYGLLCTLQSDRGGRLTPVAAPIALLRRKELSARAFGQIEAGEPNYTLYRAELERILAEGFARLVDARSMCTR